MNPIELPMAPVASAPERAPGRGRRYRVEGMDCGACAQTIERRVRALQGVEDATVSFGAGTLVVDGDVLPEVITAEVRRAGYRAEPADRRASGPATPWWRRDARTVSTLAAAPLLVVAVATTLLSAPRAVAEPLYLAAIVVGGWPMARAAAGAVRRGALDMNVLMTIAAVGAVAIGSYAEGAWVVVLFAIGTGLETLALDRSRVSMEALMELAPAQVRLVDDGERLVAADEVAPGAVYVVRPGERLGLDGVVTAGESSVDQAPITGESIPVGKRDGDDVFAGTLNVHGRLEIRVTRRANESTLSSVGRLVEEAQGSKAPAERFIDRFARIYTPIVLATALALALVPLAFGGDADTWVYRALALLIVACPCSLVISVPVAVVSAIGGAARRGTLIKGGQALEDLARVRIVALDKTGTLTLGLPRVQQVVPLDGVNAAETLGLAAAVEAGSEHPLAAAIRHAAADRGAPVPRAEAFRALPGLGAEATVDGRAMWIGGPRVAVERSGAAPSAIAQIEAAGQTAVVLGSGDRALAVFGLADRARPEASDVAADLRRAGVERVTMLTGDAERVARAVAEGAGVDDVRAGLLPQDKLDAVRALEREAPVAMVGDGVNDAPALAAATVGVAMGAAGSDVALQSADVALMGDRLDQLPQALTLARRALRIMRFNVAASIVVKGLFVVLAPFGLVTLVLAVAADMGMSLLVTLNALRLLRRAE